MMNRIGIWTLVGLALLCASLPAYADEITLDPTRIGPGWYLVTEYVTGYQMRYEGGTVIIETVDGSSPDLWVGYVVGSARNGQAIVGPDGKPFVYGRLGSYLATLVNPAYIDTASIPEVSDTGYAIQPEVTSEILPVVDGIPFKPGELYPSHNPLAEPTKAYINIEQWLKIRNEWNQLDDKEKEEIRSWSGEYLVAGELIISMLLRYDPGKGKWTVQRWTYKFLPSLELDLLCARDPESCGRTPTTPSYVASLHCTSPVWVGEASECTAIVRLDNDRPADELRATWWSSSGAVTPSSAPGDRVEAVHSAVFTASTPGTYTVHYMAEAFIDGAEAGRTEPQTATIEVLGSQHNLQLSCQSPVKPNESATCTATPHSTPPRAQTIRWFRSTGATLSASQTTGTNGAGQSVTFRAASPGTYTVRAEMLDEHSNVLTHRDAIIEVTDPHEQNHCASGGSNCEKVDMPPGFVDRPPGTGTIPTIISGPGKGTPHSGGPGAPGLLTVKVLPPYPGTARENASKVGAEVRFTVSQYEGPRTVRWRTTPNDGDVPIEQELVYTSRLIWDVTFYDTSGNPVAMYRKTENLSISDAGTVRTLTIPDVYLHQYPGTAGIAVRVQEERTRRWREDRGHLTDGMVWDSCAIYHDVDHNPDDEEPGTYHCHGGYVFDPSAVRWVSNWTHANLITSGFEQPWSNEPVREHVGGLRYEVTGAGSSLR